MSSATSTSPGTDQLLNQRYRIEERIARGGMATVHRGHDERLDRVVALKIMHPHLAADEQFRRRFAREARSAARLAHRNVVGVFDQGEDGDRIYLAMELIEGETLRARIAREGRLTIDAVLDITAQILEALAAAHEAGIVHRDIKPENVLLDTDGVVKVADFGLARAIDSAHSATSATLLGTVAYISPEVVTRGHCDERSDLYSLGAVMHEMLTGRQPFTGEQPVHIAFQHVHEDIPAPSASASGIPRGLDSLVMWAAARSPESRPASARELLRAVRELRATLPPSVLATRPEPAEACDTADVPRITAALDDAVLLTSSEPRSFAPGGAGRADAGSDGMDGTDAHPDAGSRFDEDPEAASEDGTEAADAADGTDDAAGSASDDATARRAVVMRTPRARHGRHLPRGARRRSRPLAALAALVLVGSMATSAWAGADWYLTTGPGADRTVPVIAGTALGDAEAALSSSDLQIRTEDRFSETVPAGHVISATPAPGTVVKRGSDVRVVISRGRETFSVPDLAGLELAEARTRVEAARLALVEDDPAYSETVPKGQVISQSQEAQSLPAGGEVHVVVSRGREPIVVPSVVGRSESDARGALEDAGFRVAVGHAHSARTPKGAVASQDPSRGTAHRGETIRIVISDGPEMVKVPDVFKLPEAQAKAKLESAGLKVSVKHDRGAPVFGMVYQQSAAAGSSVAKGTTVTISVF